MWAGLGAQRAEEERALGSLFASLRPHEYLVLEPGQAAQIATNPRDGADRAIYLSATEVIFRNGIRRFRFAVPRSGAPTTSKHPLVAKLVAVVIHHRPVGPGEVRVVYALDATDTVIGRVDNSETWEFRLDLLEKACALIGVAFERESFRYANELLDRFPNLADPLLEFETHHPIEEDVREYSMAIFYGGVFAVGLTGSTGMFIVITTPVSVVYRGLLAASCLVLTVLTLWAMSRRRMRRSMKKVRARKSGRSTRSTTSRPQ